MHSMRPIVGVAEYDQGRDCGWHLIWCQPF